MTPPALIDTHCHLNFHSYDEDRAAVLERAHAVGVKRIIIPAIDLETCQQALELAASFEGVYAAVGIHPNSGSDLDAHSLSQLRKFAEDNKVVAIGEIGLDYYWDKCPKPTQRHALEKQLELASELELPVIIHNRDAGDDLMAVLEAWAPTAPRSLQGRLGVLHSFSATRDIAERGLETGFYIGFTGPLTYKKNDELRLIASGVPPDRLLIETDGPFLPPQQHRGQRNEPAYLHYINARLAELHHMSAAEMAQQTTQNAETLFALS